MAKIIAGPNALTNFCHVCGRTIRYELSDVRFAGHDMTSGEEQYAVNCPAAKCNGAFIVFLKPNELQKVVARIDMQTLTH